MFWPRRRGPLRLPVTGGECVAMGLRAAYRTAGRRLSAGIMFGVALLPLGPRLATAQSPVASIAVEGNRRLEADTIRGYFKPQAGAPPDAAAGDAGLKALYASGLFTGAQIARAADRLTVTVGEAPLHDHGRIH